MELSNQCVMELLKLFKAIGQILSQNTFTKNIPIYTNMHKEIFEETFKKFAEGIPERMSERIKIIGSWGNTERISEEHAG